MGRRVALRRARWFHTNLEFMSAHDTVSVCIPADCALTLWDALLPEGLV